ncbi:Longitudinals lacking protein [Blattella germanica]|nr:Longitudinals lacking protein [Blattella germanica]
MFSGDAASWVGCSKGQDGKKKNTSWIDINPNEVKFSSKNNTQKGGRSRGIFPCEQCGRSYARKDSLQRHLQWECGKEPTFQCPFCPQRCKRKSHQIRHIRRQHSDMIDFVYPNVTKKK